MSNIKVSGFTFLRNAIDLGLPYIASIQSILPIVDEMIVVVGTSVDQTLESIYGISSSKIKIVTTNWNENLVDRGFVYAQQKMIGQYSCTGDWAFYLEGDEVLHENDLPAILSSIELHDSNPAIEALVFDYHHFYGSPEWTAISPEWYRRECRIIRNNIRSFAPDGQYWVVMDKNRKGRKPRAALANAHIYHYGHARKIEFLQRKVDQVSKYWGNSPPQMKYDIDPRAIRRFTDSHPSLVTDWLSSHAEEKFIPDQNHRLSRRERKHRFATKIENTLGIDLSRKHYQLVY